MNESDKYKAAIVERIIRVYKFYEMEKLCEWLEKQSEGDGKMKAKFKILLSFAKKHAARFDYAFKVNNALKDFDSSPFVIHEEKEEVTE